MAKGQDAFLQVCLRMQTLMREHPMPHHYSAALRIDDMILRLRQMSAVRQAA